jgi:tetratricopeptide (TPR) repeat protein
LDKVTRHDLKSDRFVEEVGHTVEYVSSHKDRGAKYGGIVLAAILLIAGGWYWRGKQAETRALDLGAAMKIRDATIAPMPNPGDTRLAFPTMQEKNNALRRALVDVAARHSGSNEAAVAHYLLGVLDSDENKMADAEKNFQKAADSGDSEYASLAKWSLQQIYTFSGREKQAEDILRGFVSKPTTMVSSEQATITLAQLISKKNPQEAMKMLEPLSKGSRQAVARYASSLLGQIMASSPTPAPPAPPPAKK